PAKSRRASDTWQIYLSRECAVESEHFDLGARVFQVGDDEHIVHYVDAVESFGCLGNQLLPVFPLGFCRVNSDDLSARGVEVGLKPKDRTVVADEAVGRIELIEQRDYVRVFRLEVFIENPVLAIAPFPHSY